MKRESGKNSIKLAAAALIVLAFCLIAWLGSRAGGGRTESADAPTPAVAGVWPQTVSAAPPRPEGVRITELMPGNDAGLTDCDGELSDWIELTNTGDAAAELSLCWLSDDAQDALKWRFPAGTVLAPGERLVVFASGKDKTGSNGELHTGFKLSRAGETITLSAPDGTVCDRVSWTDAPRGRSLCRGEGDTLVPCRTPTPGRENSEAAYLALCESAASPQGLCISEVVSDNSLTPAPDGAYYDYVELYNAADSAVELSDYCLSDSRAEAFPLPAGTLESGEYRVFFCSAAAQGSADFAPLPFSLAFEGEGLYLTRADGTLCDSCWVEIPRSNHSYGRQTGAGGFFYFAQPTPGGANAGGVRGYAETPAADVAPGLYNDCAGLTVSLSGAGEIRYTLDGSQPDERSALYAAPVPITQSCVLRARCFAPERLPGEIASFSYILNENDSLDVISLAVDPAEFLGEDGLYFGSDKERSCAGSVAYFGAEGGFVHECGVTLHGNSELDTRAQKGLQLNFGNDYGGDLDYALFGADGQSTYHSLMLRSGISREYYFIADIVYTGLFARCADATEYLRWRFVSVYVNGEYWGLYQLREHYSRGNLALRWDVPKESIEVVRATQMSGTEIRELLRWVKSHPLSEAENYAQLSAQMDLENFAEWMIIQAYSGNNDHRTNVKWVRSADYDGKWHILLYDLDRPLIFQNGLESLTSSTAELVPTLVRGLYKSPEFRALLLEKLTQMMPTLTTENTLQAVADIRAQIEPELIRSLTRWGYSVERYQRGVERLETTLREGDLPGAMARSARELLGLDETQLRQAFGAAAD